MEDTQEAELRNPFPSPPSHYTNYTTHNLQLLSLLRERAVGQYASESTQIEILSDQNNVPEWPLTSLEKPRVDWIREEGFYNVFGDTWFVRIAQYSIASDV
jgi:mediator of RNA polymerase II transcription subunit 7